MKNKLDRRSFLKTAGYSALGVSALGREWPALGEEHEEQTSFRSAWPQVVERPWPGPDYWSNPLQDWRVKSGRLECISAGGDRNVALLTREVAARSGDLMLRVLLGKLDPGELSEGFVGFRLGVKQPYLNDYRASAIYG